MGTPQHTFPNESEDDFYDAFDTSPSVTMDELDQMQSYNDMNDSCMLYQSRGDLGGLSWSQEDSTLLDGGAGEAAFSEDLTLVRNRPEKRMLFAFYLVMLPKHFKFLVNINPSLTVTILRDPVISRANQ